MGAIGLTAPLVALSVAGRWGLARLLADELEGRNLLRLVAFGVGFTFLASVLAQGTERLDFKGIPFSVSQKQFEQLFPMAAWCRVPKDRRTADVTCGAVRENIKCDVRGAPKNCAEERDKAYTYAGARMHAFMANFYNDALASMHVSFYSSDFDSILAALISRYGKPDEIKSEPLQTRVGAVYENTIASWRKSDSTLLIRKYAGSISTGAAAYVLDGSTAEFEKRRGEAAKKGAKDL